MRTLKDSENYLCCFVRAHGINNDDLLMSVTIVLCGYFMKFDSNEINLKVYDLVITFGLEVIAHRVNQNN